MNASSKPRVFTVRSSCLVSVAEDRSRYYTARPRSWYPKHRFMLSLQQKRPGIRKTISRSSDGGRLGIPAYGLPVLLARRWSCRTTTTSVPRQRIGILIRRNAPNRNATPVVGKVRGKAAYWLGLPRASRKERRPRVPRTGFWMEPSAGLFRNDFSVSGGVRIRRTVLCGLTEDAVPSLAAPDRRCHTTRHAGVGPGVAIRPPPLVCRRKSRPRPRRAALLFASLRAFPRNNVRLSSLLAIVARPQTETPWPAGNAHRIGIRPPKVSVSLSAGRSGL